MSSWPVARLALGARLAHALAAGRAVGRLGGERVGGRRALGRAVAAIVDGAVFFCFLFFCFFGVVVGCEC